MKTIILMSLIICFQNSFSQINCFYSNNDKSLFCENLFKFYDEYVEFKIGESNKAIKIYEILKNDTILIFESFGCTQFGFSEKDKRIILYVWPRYYYNTDCLCIDWDEKPCRPDTSKADLRIVFDFNEEVKCHISKIPFYEHENEWVSAIMDSLTKLEYNKYIRLSTFNKLFRKKLYEQSCKLTHFIAYNFNNYDIFFFNNFNQIDLNLIDRNVEYIVKNENWTKQNKHGSSFWYNYDYTRNLIRYIKPMAGKSFKGDEIYEFSSYVLKLYEPVYFH